MRVLRVGICCMVMVVFMRVPVIMIVFMGMGMGMVMIGFFQSAQARTEGVTQFAIYDV